MGRRKKDVPAVPVIVFDKEKDTIKGVLPVHSIEESGAAKTEVIEVEIPRDPSVRPQGWPPFGARVLVWDERFECWVCAYYCRVGRSNTEGRFEEWFRGESRVVPGGIWQYLPAKPAGAGEGPGKSK